MENRRLSPKNYRKDHEDFGEVQSISYKMGRITEFGVEKLDPITLDDTAKVEFEGGGASNFIPIFYHCKEDFYTKEGCAELNEARGSLNHAARAFELDMEVKVMFKDAVPFAIIGHADNTPRYCVDIIRFDLHSYSNACAFGPQNAGPLQRYHFRASDQTLMCDKNLPCFDVKGHDLRCTKKGQMLCGSHEVQFATVVFYLGDWLIELGPLFFIFMVYAVGLPGPMVGQVYMCAAPASKELKERTIAQGLKKEASIPDRILHPPPPAEFYPEFTIQSKFTQLLYNRWAGWTLDPPRWIFSEFYTQEHKI